MRFVYSANDYAIEKIFGKQVLYIEFPETDFITKDTFLTIVWDYQIQKPDTEITLQDYLNIIDDAFKRGVI